MSEKFSFGTGYLILIILFGLAGLAFPPLWLLPIVLVIIAIKNDADTKKALREIREMDQQKFNW